MSKSEHSGMTPREQWKESPVHRASRYFCQKCGKEFGMPQDLYDHLDEEHTNVSTTRTRKR